MPLDDLREYVQTLEGEHLVKRVSAEVDWNLEIGAISRLACELRAPAPFFENVTGYPNQSVLGVVMGPSSPALHARVAVALGAKPESHPLDLIELVRERFRSPRPPVVVDREEAPCKEVVLRGAEASLLAFPAPWTKSIDGGRYIGTWDIVVTQDPRDSGWCNWGVYRCMVHDERTFGILLFPGAQHGGTMFAQYEAVGQPMPLAVVIGADPSSQLAAIAPLGAGVSESAVAGGLRGAAVPLVQCETNNLLVPATAEIVIEAEIVPGSRAPEGPFGEYTGHAAHRGSSPVARVTCITHRRNPISTMANMGKPWDDAATPLSILVSALAKDRLMAAGLPVVDAYLPAPQTAIVVSVKPRPGLAQKVFANLYSGYRIFQAGLVLVDEDVDVTNTEDVWWSIASRLRADRFRRVEGVPAANPLLPFLTPHERLTGETSVWIMDTTFPTDWSAEYRQEHTTVSDFANGWSNEVQQQVVRRWTEYGYDSIDNLTDGAAWRRMHPRLDRAL